MEETRVRFLRDKYLKGNCIDCGKKIQKQSKRCRACFCKSIKGKGNVNWKEFGVGYVSLHEWVRANKKAPKKCERCGKKARLDAANISGKYLRDLRDWSYLCRKCYMNEDGRINNLKQYGGD